MKTDRRAALHTLGLAAGAVAAGFATPAQAAAPGKELVPAGATHLKDLMARLAKAPRRRDFKTAPMILTSPDQWDDAALKEVMAYRPQPKQAWDMTDIGGPWLNLLRNTLNVQIWGFRHPDFLAVALCHSSANLALYDQAMWDKYQLTRLAGERFKTNRLIVETAAGSANPENIQDATGAFSPKDNTIPALMRRGVVFMACHNAIWEQAEKLHGMDINPDKLGVDAIAAELTNHLIPDVVLTPGAVGTMPELQMAGFHYAK